MIKSFEEHSKIKKEAEAFRKKMINLIDEFVQYYDFDNANFNKSEYDHAFEFNFTDDHEDVEHRFRIHYGSKFGTMRQLILTNEEYQDLIKFIDDPDFYKTAKKYNV